MHHSRSERRNRGFAGNKTAPALAWGSFIAAKHPYSPRAGLLLLEESVQNCSSTTSKGCSQQVLCRLKPRSGVAPPVQIWPRAPPGAVSTAQRPRCSRSTPRETTNRHKNPDPALNEPRVSPKTFTRRTGCRQTPAGCVSVPLPLLMSRQTPNSLPREQQPALLLLRNTTTQRPGALPAAINPLTPAIRRLGSHRKSSPRFQQPSSPGKRQAVASHGAPIAPGTTLPCWQARMEEKEASCIT